MRRWLCPGALLVLAAGTRPTSIEISEHHPGQLIQIKSGAEESAAHERARVHRDAHGASGTAEHGQLIQIKSGAEESAAHDHARVRRDAHGASGTAEHGTDGARASAASGRSGNETNGNDTAEEKAEKKLEKQETSSFSRGLAAMSMAATNPREFLLERKEMQAFQAAMKLALDTSGNQGKCFKAGEFKGNGCAPGANNAAPLCSCASLFDYCYLPTDSNAAVKKFSSGDLNGAMELAKVVVFGQCTISYLMVGAAVFVGLLVVGIVLFALRSMLAKKRSRSSRKAEGDDSGY